jgi:hypothetical protein
MMEPSQPAEAARSFGRKWTAIRDGYLPHRTGRGGVKQIENYGLSQIAKAKKTDGGGMPRMMANTWIGPSLAVGPPLHCRWCCRRNRKQSRHYHRPPLLLLLPLFCSCCCRCHCYYCWRDCLASNLATPSKRSNRWRRALDARRKEECPQRVQLARAAMEGDPQSLSKTRNWASRSGINHKLPWALTGSRRQISKEQRALSKCHPRPCAGLAAAQIEIGGAS